MSQTPSIGSSHPHKTGCRFRCCNIRKKKKTFRPDVWEDATDDIWRYGRFRFARRDPFVQCVTRFSSVVFGLFPLSPLAMGLSVQTLAHTHFCGRRHNFPYIRYIPKKVFYLFIFFVLLAVSLCVLLIRRFRGGFWTHHVQKDVFLFGPVCRWETSDRVRWTNLLMTTLSFNRQPNCFTSVCPWRPRIFFLADDTKTGDY